MIPTNEISEFHDILRELFSSNIYEFNDPIYSRICSYDLSKCCQINLRYSNQFFEQTKDLWSINLVQTNNFITLLELLLSMFDDLTALSIHQFEQPILIFRIFHEILLCCSKDSTLDFYELFKKNMKVLDRFFVLIVSMIEVYQALWEVEIDNVPSVLFELLRILQLWSYLSHKNLTKNNHLIDICFNNFGKTLSLVYVLLRLTIDDSSLKRQEEKKKHNLLRKFTKPISWIVSKNSSADIISLTEETIITLLCLLLLPSPNNIGLMETLLYLCDMSQQPIEIITKHYKDTQKQLNFGKLLDKLLFFPKRYSLCLLQTIGVISQPFIDCLTLSGRRINQVIIKLLEYVSEYRSIFALGFLHSILESQEIKTSLNLLKVEKYKINRRNYFGENLISIILQILLQVFENPQADGLNVLSLSIFLQLSLDMKDLSVNTCKSIIRLILKIKDEILYNYHRNNEKFNFILYYAILQTLLVSLSVCIMKNPEENIYLLLELMELGEQFTFIVGLLDDSGPGKNLPEDLIDPSPASYLAQLIVFLSTSNSKHIHKTPSTSSDMAQKIPIITLVTSFNKNNEFAVNLNLHSLNWNYLHTYPSFISKLLTNNGSIPL
eukprot:TRINITY_DN1874_c0_g1_i1.p1 TRINITY_DN1874_c0_g1~~TRINITY_DN1874_c0_g1_i1.p1  ORF type:complete len:608 (-),score=113.83 TRINITY_DN1874_c0_g1_i1:14-1837(-)